MECQQIINSAIFAVIAAGCPVKPNQNPSESGSDTSDNPSSSSIASGISETLTTSVSSGSGAPTSSSGSTTDTSSVSAGTTDTSDPSNGEYILDELVANGFGFVIEGPLAGAGVGSSLGHVGDWNGDGVQEILIAAPIIDSVFVVFGGDRSGSLELKDLVPSQGGVKLQADGEFLGSSIASVGDFNGDGREDIGIGASGVDENGFSSGRIYVLAGPQVSSVIDIASLTMQGSPDILRTIDGNGANVYMGSGVVSMGDVNGDTFSDLAAIRGEYRELGTSLVLGGPVPGSITASDLGMGIGGFECVWFGDQARVRLGDVNGDGLDDFTIFGLTSARVVFGKEDTAPVKSDNVEMGIGGFEVKFSEEYVSDDRFGHDADFGRDFDGDGASDFVLSAPSSAVSAQILLLRGGLGTQETTLSELKAQNAVRPFHGPGSGLFGESLELAADMNGDSRGEMVVGSPNNDQSAVYLIWGSPGTDSVDVPLLVQQGGALRFSLVEPVEFGYAVHVAEVTGDGVDDVLIGVPSATSPEGMGGGRVFVLSGSALAKLAV